MEDTERGLRHDFDATDAALGLRPLFRRQHVAEGVDRDLDLVERRLARRQRLQPQPWRQQLADDRVVRVPGAEAD
jgi:hypothetical protein